MNTIRLIAAAIAVAAAALVAGAKQNLYATGQFNGWDPKAPAEFTAGSDGTYSLDIDFSAGRDFKMSTTTGAGSEGNGWTEFDAGALKPVGTAVLGEWIALENNHSGNIVAPDSKTLTVQVDLAAMRLRFTRSSAPEYSGTLPVLFINTEGGAAIDSKEVYLQATYYLDPLDCPGIEAIGSADAPLTTQIRGRGNYTWTGFDKKPYRLKLADKQPLLGMNKSRHFVLLAHADDRVGFMRNTLGFAASRLLGLPWTPAQEPVEVVLNGDYIGLYFLTENIRVAKDRVNITEQDDLATTDVSGGWLVEIDNYDSDPHVTVMEGSYPIWFTYKSPEELSAEQRDFLTEQMQGIQDAIAAKDYTRFSALVDADMLARYYVVQEVMNDYESFHGSCYLNRQRGDSERWKFGPVWDFGSALFRDNDNRFIYDSEYHQVWIGAICAAFPQFMENVKDVWDEYTTTDGTATLLAEGRDLAVRISAAAAANHRRWPDYGNADEMEAAQVAFDRMLSKTDWLDKQWGGASLAEISMTGPTLHVSAADGTLLITAGQACTTTLATPDGRTRSIDLHEGLNTIHGLAKGIYIVGRTKIAL